jgi:hypothetical protein
MKMSRELWQACAVHEASPEAMLLMARETVQYLEWLFPGSGRGRDRKRKGLKNLTSLGRRVDNLTPDDIEARKREPDPLDLPLVPTLYGLLRAHLSTSCSDRAIYHVLALILIAFDLKSGTPDVVAARLKQDLYRAANSKPSRRSRTAKTRRTQSRTAKTTAPDSHQI